ncbi:MAG: anthranilate synthase component I family protein [Planctomycetota bacterium]|nr:anthranilate synthase component I family protein [Planctomycetota bacterium]
MPRLRKLAWDADPMQVALAWPIDRPLQMLHSGRVHPRWARFSILASPRVVFRSDGLSTLNGADDLLLNVDLTHDPLVDLDRLLEATRLDPNAGMQHSIPFSGGWIGYLSYDLGRYIEPVAQHSAGPEDDRHWPFLELAWCPDALIYDHVEHTWFEIGTIPELEALMSRVRTGTHDETTHLDIGDLKSSIDRQGHMKLIERTVDHIARGDLFQANITQRFSASFQGEPRELWRNAMIASRAWYGGYLEFDDPQGKTARRIVSLSPELFLHVDQASRLTTTRPIKGTRSLEQGAKELLESVKDQAELNMIIDLMRNDLGRVCEYGTVKVTTPRMIETHPTIHHGVGEIQGVLREDVSIGDLLKATFPAGSVTGAPKIRAMQLIDELESVRRGPYCGSVGFFCDSGNVELSVSIRTIGLTGTRDPITNAFSGVLDYGAGGGIVAESQAGAEYRESLDKIEVLLETIRGIRNSLESPLAS